MVAGAASLLFIMYLLDHLLNPLGYGLIVAIILYPIRQQPVARALLYATAYLTGLWFFYDSGHLLIPFILAYIIAFLVNPIVVWFEKKNIRRPYVAVVITGIGFVIVGLVFFFGVPFLTQQATALAKFLSTANNNADEWLQSIGILDFASRIGLDASVLQEKLTEQMRMITDNLYNGITGARGKTFNGVGSIITVMFFIILLPFLLYFMIRDYRRIGVFVRSTITPKQVPIDYTQHVATILGNYLRGQFIVVVISMINLSIGFTLFGLPYAVLLGIFSGLTNFIPTFGLWLSVSVVSIVGITFGTPWWEFLPGIYIVFGLEQILETGFIVPRIIGKHVGLHPVVVMLSLLLFGFMFGFLGLLIAVPSVALFSVFWEEYQKTHKLPFLSGAELDHEKQGSNAQENE